MFHDLNQIILIHNAMIPFLHGVVQEQYLPKVYGLIHFHHNYW